LGAGYSPSHPEVSVFDQSRKEETSPTLAGLETRFEFSNVPSFFFLRAPPEGGVCSSWIKHRFSHSLRQRLRGVTEKWTRGWARGGGRKIKVKERMMI
jgi:hypothetical protein